MALPWLEDEVEHDPYSVRQVFAPVLPDQSYDLPNSYAPNLGLARAPSTIPRLMGEGMTQELLELERKTMLPGSLANIVEAPLDRVGKLRNARNLVRSPATLGNPILGLAMLHQVQELEDAGLRGDDKRFQNARDNLMLTAGASLGIDVLLAGDEVLAQIKSVPSRVLAGQGLGDAARAVGESAIRRPLGGVLTLGAIAALSALFSPDR